MLTVKFLEENTEEVIARLAVKNFDGRTIVHQVLEADKNRKQLQVRSDTLQNELNALAREIGQMMKSGQALQAGEAKRRTAELKEEVKSLAQQQSEAEETLRNLLVTIPNLP